MNKNIYTKKKALYLLYFLLTFGTFSIQAQVETFMTNQGATNSLVQCEGFFFDDGGISQPYGDTNGAKTDILTFCPDNPSQQSIRITFQSFDVAPGDRLIAFDGQDTLANQFTTSSQGSGSGASVADSPGGSGVTSSCDNLSGCVTFAFYRNGDGTKGAGWKATVECATKTTTKLDCSRVEDFNGSAGRHLAVAECADGKAFIRVPIPSFTDCGRLGRLNVSSSCTADFPASVVAIGTGYVETYFPIGSHTITFESEDFPELNCTANIQVISPGMGCNDDLNVSLSNECVVTLTPDLMLEGDCSPAYLTRPGDGAQVPAFFYEVELSADDDVEILGYTIDGYPIANFGGATCNTRYDVKITRKYIADTDCDGKLFDGLNLDDEPLIDFCWGQIVIEDKVAPRILDSPDPIAIPCYEKNEDPTKLLQKLNNIDRNLQGLGGTLNLPLSNIDIQIEGKEAVDVFENCYFEVTASSWEFVSGDCEDSETITTIYGEEIESSIFGFYRRVFSAKDRCNNEALQEQIIYVYQPEIVAASPEIEVPCGVDIDPESLRNEWLAWVAADRPANDPRKYYASFLPNFDPTFISLEWYEITDSSGDEVPLDVTSTDCGYAVDWSDSDTIYVCGGGFKIFRTWTIYDWCDGILELTNVVPQVIKVGDDVAPEILGNMIYEVASSPQLDCSVNVRFFKPVAQDDCAGVVDLSIRVAGQTKSFFGNTLVVENIPIGEELTIEWVARDACGNTSTESEVKTFEDVVAPVAVCETLRTVSLGSDCTTIIPAESFDDGSFDNCGTVNFSVARALENGFPEDEDFEPFIELSRVDLGENCDGRVEVLFRVMDGAGNANYCSGDIILQDKLPPFNQPFAETISCDDPAVDELLQIKAIAGTSDRLGAFADLLMSNENMGQFNGTDNCSGNGQMTISVLSADFAALDGTCRSGVISYTYRLIDGCGNGSASARNTLTIDANSDWTMNFPPDLELFCEEAAGANPAASTIQDILTNNGCDFWGMEVTEERLEDNTDACYKIIYTYQFINWCNWSPNNTELAIVERPKELITDPIHTVALRFQDKWNNDLVAGGDCTSAAANTPDGINDIDDGNEDFDFEAGAYGSSCPSNNPVWIYKAFDLNRDRSSSYEETRSGIMEENQARIPLRVFDQSVNRNREQDEIIRDQDEATNFDVYDVTDSKIDGDFVIIDTGDTPYGNVPTYNLKSQFTNQVQTYVSAQTYGNIAYRQIVKVIDISAPTVSLEDFGAFCGGEEQTNGGEACTAEVEVKFAVSDVCSALEDIQVSYTLKAFGGDATNDGFGNLVNEGAGKFAIKGTYPLSDNGETATHVFVVRVEDGCSNTEVVEIPFEVKDCKAPVVYCRQGLSATMSEEGEVLLWASDFDAGSIDFCTPKEDLKYTFADPNLYPDSTSRTFRCESGEVGDIFVYFWVQDLAGNTAFCETFVKISPFSNSGCNGENLAQITGLILTEEDGSVQEAAVMLAGGADDMRMTNSNGGYAFDAVEMGYDYSITPEKDNGHLEGVSTFDMILISKHILNVEKLDSPYKMIAADINNSGTITTNDMIALRRLILGQSEEFPDNTSWRFVPADHTFPNPSNPWAEDFPENLSFNDVESDMEEADFVGIKVGDVNGSVNDFNSELEGRGLVEIEATTKQVAAGELYTLPLQLKTETNLEGLQMTLKFNPDFLKLVEIGDGLLSKYHFGTNRLEEGILLVSWVKGKEEKLTANDLLANLQFEVLKAVSIEEVVEISDDALSSEAYLTNGNKANLSLSFNANIEKYQLYQNEPNPFSESTNIAFDLPNSELVQVRIYSTTGQLVYDLKEVFEVGTHTLTINRELFKESGIYYYQLNTATYNSTKKMIFTK